MDVASDLTGVYNRIEALADEAPRAGHAKEGLGEACQAHSEKKIVVEHIDR